MKKILLLVMCVPAVLAAQNGVTVSGFSVSAGIVTFNVCWGDKQLPTLWSDTVWVFVDYNAGGVMKRLPLASGATLTATSAPGVGKVIEEENNDKGVWVVGNAKSDANSSGSFSAKVQLLTTENVVSGACAYASNYPPVGEYLTASSITFTGTPPFDLKMNTGAISVQKGYVLLENQTLLSFTDKTGAPGIIKCIPPATFTLLASASGFCSDDATGITFALDDTEDGRKYQLHKGSDAVGNVLSSMGGGAATFTGGPFNVAGTYTAWTVAEGLTCAMPMNRSHVVIENPLPDNPDVLSNTRKCAGTVTLSASTPGAVIDWYTDISSTATLYTGASYTTPAIFASTTYYVQARIENTGCLSARMAATAEVDMEGCRTAPGATTTFTAFMPASSATNGTVWYLTDDRAGGNNNTYIVKKMADGHIWMVQDLKFGTCANDATTTWYNDNSVAATTHSPTIAPGYVGHCRSNTAAGTGFYYTWPAAMQNSAAYYGSTIIAFACRGTLTGTESPNPGYCQGICPTGWHVPTAATNSDWHGLYNAGCNTLALARGTTLSNPLHFHATAANYYTNADGAISLFYTSEQNSYWSSTRAINSPPIAPDVWGYQTYNSNNDFESNVGLVVRCLMNY